MPSANLPPAMILAGGRSERFGEDKALVTIDGQPLILRLRDQLLKAGHQTNFIANRADRYAELGLECLIDAQPDSGPLAGLATALAHHRSHHAHANWILLVSCDQVQWLSQWSQRLVEAITITTLSQPHPLAVVFASTMWQPLPGLYHVDLLDEVRERLKQRRLSLHGLLESCHEQGRTVGVQEHDPPNGWTFNTRDELNRLLTRA